MIKGRHLLTESGESLTVFRIKGHIGLARGRQPPDETIQMTIMEAYELADELMGTAEFEEELRGER